MANYSSLKKNSNTLGKGGAMASAATTPQQKAAAKKNTVSFDGGSPMSGQPIGGPTGGSLTDALGITKPNMLNTAAIPAPREVAQPTKKSFADYLAVAQQLLGSGSSSAATPDLSVFANQASQVQGQAADADSKLAAMYSALQNNFNSQAPGIAAQYKAASNDLAANSDQAASSVNKGYASAEASLAAQLKKQGIGDAMQVIANHGTSLQGDQAQANANIQQDKAATLNHNTGDGQAALTYNKGVSNAAQLAGGEARATNQLNLQKLLGSIDSQKAAAQLSAQNAATSNAPSASAISDLAQQLFQNDPSSEYSDTPAEQLKGSAAATAANKAMASQDASTKSRLSSTYTALLKINNGDADKTNTMIKQMQKAGLL